MLILNLFFLELNENIYFKLGDSGGNFASGESQLIIIIPTFWLPQIESGLELDSSLAEM